MIGQTVQTSAAGMSGCHQNARAVHGDRLTNPGEATALYAGHLKGSSHSELVYRRARAVNNRQREFWKSGPSRIVCLTRTTHTTYGVKVLKPATALYCVERHGGLTEKLHSWMVLSWQIAFFFYQALDKLA